MVEITKKRNITNQDRKQFRKNALKGTDKTRGKKRTKSKYGKYSYGWESTPKGTKPRKHDKGKVITHIFRAGGKRFVMLLRKEKTGRGKQPYAATVIEEGRPQSSLDHGFRVDAGSFPKAAEEAVKRFKSRK